MHTVLPAAVVPTHTVSMSQSMQTYVQAVARALHKALCIQPFPSTKLERYTAPEVEIRDSPELLLDPVLIKRAGKDSKDCCLIEASINSARVSICFHTADALEAELLSMYVRFMMQRADSIQCLRKVPMQGYHLTFLVTDTLLVSMGKAAILQLITHLIQQSESDITALKLAVNARGRAVATQLLRALAY